jgi:hypothetical protein
VEKATRGVRIGPPSAALAPCPADDPEGDYAAYVVRLEEQIATHSASAEPVDDEEAPDRG